MPRQARTFLALSFGLIFLAGCTAGQGPIASVTPAATTAPVDWSKAEKVDMTLKSFAFVPDRLTFREGQPYELHLQNSSDSGHNLDAPDFFRSAVLKPGKVADRIRAAGGLLELKPGDAADIYFVPTKTGTYPIKCSHFLHASFGMVGQFKVEKGTG